MKTPYAILILLALCTLGSRTSLAEAFQSHPSITDSVQQYLLSQPDIQRYSEASIDVGNIDSRLQLQQCDHALDISLAPGARYIGKTTAGVRCSTPQAWALYVPANIIVYEQVYQTSRPLARDHILTAEDITAVKTDLGKLNRGYYTNPQEVLGKQTRHPLQQSQILNPGQIKSPHLVKRGEQVALVVAGSQFAIRMQGQALADGAEGEQVRVKNLSSNRIVEGTVTRQGTVRVMN